MHIKEDALAEWRKGIEDRGSFLAEPDQHREKMIRLAHAAHRSRQIDAGDLCDMLEIIDCALVWAAVEISEAERIGLFAGRTPREDA